MGNKLDRRIERIQRDVVACLTRVVAAVELDRKRPTSPNDIRRVVEEAGKNAKQIVENTLRGDHGLQYKWIAEGLTKIRQNLSEIDTERVIVTKKQGRPTVTIFETHIVASSDKIDGKTFGIIQNTNELFDKTGNDRPTTASLHLLHEVSGTAKVIRRQLKVLRQPALEFVYSYKVPGIVLLCGLAAIPICYAYRATSSTKGPPTTAVKVQLEKDKEAINKELNEPAKSNFEKVITVGEHITQAVTVIPNLLVGLALLLSLYRYAFVTQRWRHGGVDGFRKDLLEASKSVKALAGSEKA